MGLAGIGDGGFMNEQLPSKERCGLNGCVLDKGHPGAVHNTTAALVGIARACAVDLRRVGRPTAADGVEAIAKEVLRLQGELDARDALDGEWQSEIDRLTRERDAAYASQRMAAEVFEKHRKSTPHTHETRPTHSAWRHLNLIAELSPLTPLREAVEQAAKHATTGETPAVAVTKDIGDLLMAITTLRQKTEDAEVLAKHVWDTATALEAVAPLNAFGEIPGEADPRCFGEMPPENGGPSHD